MTMERAGGGRRVTLELAQFVHDCQYSSMPDSAIRAAKRCMVDWLGCALAGSASPAVSILLRVVTAMGSSPQATVLGIGRKISCVDAALVNGTSSHVLDYDDINRSMRGHPSVPVLPAALALAESRGLSGRDLLLSYILGYEVEARVGSCLGPSHYRQWHTTSNLGTLGAATAASKLLGLNQNEIATALGIAGGQASGLRDNLSTMAKPLQAGKAAAAGLQAALLAQEGFTASQSTLESEKGFCNTFSQESDPHRITSGLGSSYEVERTAFKAHACCGTAQSAVDALLGLRESQRLEPSAIEAIHVRVHPLGIEAAGNVSPMTELERKHSLPYSLAVAMATGRVSEDLFDDQQAGDPVVRSLMSKVAMESDPGFEFREAVPAVVTVRTADGQQFTRRVDLPRGRPSNPMTDAELAEKFFRLAGLRLPDSACRELYQMIESVEEVPKVGLLAERCGSTDAGKGGAA